MKTRMTLALAIGALAAGQASGQSRVLYSNTFEAREFGREWSSNTHLESWYPTFTTFNGNYSSSFTELTLPARPPGSNSGPGGGGGGSYQYVLYTVTFDFYAIDSWDGEDTRWGADRFEVLANGQRLMRDSFSNHANVRQTFRAADVGGRDLGFDERWEDSIYRRIALDFTVPDGAPIRIRWQDNGLQGMNDESWGIDNVQVSYRTVPAPSATAAVGLGLAGTLRRRRR